MPEPDDVRRDKGETKPFLIWRGDAEKSNYPSNVRDIRPGDVVVVPASYGGCDDYGWHPQSVESVTDIGNAAIEKMALRGMQKLTLRLSRVAEDNPDQKEFRVLLHHQLEGVSTQKQSNCAR